MTDATSPTHHGPAPGVSLLGALIFSLSLWGLILFGLASIWLTLVG